MVCDWRSQEVSQVQTLGAGEMFDTSLFQAQKAAFGTLRVAFLSQFWLKPILLNWESFLDPRSKARSGASSAGPEMDFTRF
jgi:hypothetical protein